MNVYTCNECVCPQFQTTGVQSKIEGEKKESYMYAEKILYNYALG